MSRKSVSSENTVVLTMVDLENDNQEPEPGTVKELPQQDRPISSSSSSRSLVSQGAKESTTDSDDAKQTAATASKKGKRVRCLNPISLLLDLGDALVFWTKKFITNYVLRMRWQALILFMLLSLVYFAVTPVAVWVLLPMSYSWLNYVHQTALTTGLIVAYITFIGFMYMKIKMERWRKGELQNWKIPRIVILLMIVAIVLLICAGIITTVLMVVLNHDNMDQNRIIQVVIIDLGLLACAVGVITLLIFSVVKPKKAKDQSSKGDNKEAKKKKRRSCGCLAPIARLLQKIVDWLSGVFWFPWFFQIVPYLMCFIYGGVGSFFIVLYGIKFDSDKDSVPWLKSSGTGIAKDIFLNSPIQYVIKGLVFLAIISLLEIVFFRVPNKLKSKNKVEPKAAEQARTSLAEARAEDQLELAPQESRRGSTASLLEMVKAFTPRSRMPVLPISDSPIAAEEEAPQIVPECFAEPPSEEIAVQQPQPLDEPHHELQLPTNKPSWSSQDRIQSRSNLATASFSQQWQQQETDTAIPLFRKRSSISRGSFSVRPLDQKSLSLIKQKLVLQAKVVEDAPATAEVGPVAAAGAASGSSFAKHNSIQHIELPNKKMHAKVTALVEKGDFLSAMSVMQPSFIPVDVSQLPGPRSVSSLSATSSHTALNDFDDTDTDAELVA